MNDGTIGIDKAKGFVGWCIKRISGKPWGHSKTYLYGFAWESTIWWKGYWFHSGIKVSLAERTPSDCYLQTVTPETPAQTKAEVRFFLDDLDRRRPYNIALLLILALVIPHRHWFEKHLHWVPFGNADLGRVCSTTVDAAKKAAGIDLLPGMETITAPGDFLNSPLLERVI